jgi:uncharacterized membrane protein YgdD (TMEM256/DUF423 family)
VAPLARILAAVNGLCAVALGAFGAHGLKGRLAPLADGAQRLDWWHTAASYQLGHVVAFVLCAQLLDRDEGPGRASRAAVPCFALGVLLFCGSLYVMALTGVSALGRVTPFGGLFLLAGWVALLVASVRERR